VFNPCLAATGRFGASPALVGVSLFGSAAGAMTTRHRKSASQDSEDEPSSCLRYGAAASRLRPTTGPASKLIGWPNARFKSCHFLCPSLLLLVEQLSARRATATSQWMRPRPSTVRSPWHFYNLLRCAHLQSHSVTHVHRCLLPTMPPAASPAVRWQLARAHDRRYE